MDSKKGIRLLAVFTFVLVIILRVFVLDSINLPNYLIQVINIIYYGLMIYGIIVILKAVLNSNKQ